MKSTEQTWEKGNILRVAHEGRFGFIKADNEEYESEIFVHISKFINTKAFPNVGERVRFYVVKTEKGLEARQVCVQVSRAFNSTDVTVLSLVRKKQIMRSSLCQTETTVGKFLERVIYSKLQYSFLTILLQKPGNTKMKHCRHKYLQWQIIFSVKKLLPIYTGVLYLLN